MENEKSDNMGKRVVQSVVLVMGVIILVLMSALIVGSLVNSSSFADTVTTGTNTNETLSAVDNVTASTFAIITTYPNAICVLDSVVNASNAVNVTSGNYTFTGDGCTIILEDDSEYIGEDLNVTYDWTNTQSNVGGLNTTWIGVQFGLFVTALLGFLAVIGVIIAIVWLISYIKPLFGKEGIESFGGN